MIELTAVPIQVFRPLDEEMLLFWASMWSRGAREAMWRERAGCWEVCGQRVVVLGKLG